MATQLVTAIKSGRDIQVNGMSDSEVRELIKAHGERLAEAFSPAKVAGMVGAAVAEATTPIRQALAEQERQRGGVIVHAAENDWSSYDLNSPGADQDSNKLDDEALNGYGDLNSHLEDGKQ